MRQGLKENIIRLFHKGYKYKQIEEELKCSRGSVSQYCSSLIDKKYTKEKIEKYQEFYNKVGDISKTAKEFKIGRRQLAKYIDKSQYILPPKKERINSYYKRMKLLSIEYKGGKCLICGYNKCYWSMDFHHRNPNQKEFTISGGTRSFESLKTELDKCDLLCKNCHAEVHAGLHKDIYSMEYSRMASTSD